MSDKIGMIFCLILLLLFVSVVFIIERKTTFKYEQGSCNKITHGDFGDRLCGYNIEDLCYQDHGINGISQFEKKVCNKYFKLKGV